MKYECKHKVPTSRKTRLNALERQVAKKKKVMPTSVRLMGRIYRNTKILCTQIS